MLLREHFGNIWRRFAASTEFCAAMPPARKRLRSRFAAASRCSCLPIRPNGIELGSEWRDRSGINKHGPAEPSYMKRRIEGHMQTTISGDTIADCSPASF